MYEEIENQAPTDQSYATPHFYKDFFLPLATWFLPNSI
ncbi:hypothetical protein SynROS8604_01608 [Synechococcus sp. ROS8604]|nr:hypothetical protein SynROS8604_01608 [Synechococcus sp. ROS8604]